MEYILGIETSCDETSVAIVCNTKDHKKRLLSNCIVSQIKEHEVYGGVIPEIAARNHLHYLPKVLDKALVDANLTLTDISKIAVTAGPGLIGGVLVGVQFAKGLSQSLKIPCYGINHLEGHALVPRLNEDIDFPFLLLLASGGHCQFLNVLGVGKYELLGSTIDDAIGEAFDKVGKMMGLPYPAGPLIERLAKNGNPRAFDLPKPLFHDKNANLSFSGLKTAVKNIIDKNIPLTDDFKADMAASFQDTVGCILQKKTQFIFNHHSFERMVIAGGVAANQYLKSVLQNLCQDHRVALFTPPISLCTDNAAMIAWAAVEHVNAQIAPVLHDAKPRWPLYASRIT
ncbi:MAG: tRNA N6-adenosine threonylcarbamoyltransferase [Holosporales bacterium]